MVDNNYKIEIGDTLSWECRHCKDVTTMKCVGKGKVETFITERRILECQTCNSEQSVLLRNGEVTDRIGDVVIF